MYEEGGWMPKWPNPGYSNVMIGTHSDSVIADAYLKGIRGFDAERAYEAMCKNAMVEPPRYYEAREGITQYKRVGYVPTNLVEEATSRTLEFAYDDYCIAQMAKALGKTDEQEYFMERAGYYKNVFDPSIGFVRGRNLDGSWAQEFLRDIQPAALVSGALPGGQGLEGEYFNNIKLKGEPALVRCDKQINFDWGGGSPAKEVNPDHFSVRWSGKLVPFVTRTYKLAVTSDDGIRLYLDGELLIDGWHDRSATTDTVSLNLKARQQYDIKIEYYERGGNACARLSWDWGETPSFDPTRLYEYLTEGNPWQYSWFVPHDVEGLINLMGGRDEFIKRLDMGRRSDACYWHGNEPSHHVAYLYDYAGVPWKTQEWVREIMEKSYGTNPDGLCGNDDCGQLSAWYVFSAMGFYPVCPGIPSYEIGSPIFDEVVIHLDEYWGSEDFVILAKNNSPKNRYIQSAALNGELLDKPWLTHEEIINGGALVFEMGPKPNKEWGSKPELAPPSMTKRE
jgi:putative alpha-1,2-mannosidase